MFESLRIRNYRVFDDLEMSGLHRVNLIAGRNNSGKTSLLEAIFLLCGAGNPRLGANGTVLRMTDFGDTPNLQTLEFIWKDMFHTLDINRPIEIAGVHSEHGALNLAISLEAWLGAPQVAPSVFDGIPTSQASDGKALTFRYEDRRYAEDAYFGQVRLVPAGLEMSHPDAPNLASARIVFARTGNVQDDAELLGNLRLRKHGDFLLDALRIIEPNLASVEVVFTGGTPMIWGDIGLSELVPLPAMGEGMTRLARIVLGISSVAGGVLLVDEIENGIHHSAMSKIWRAMGQAADRFNTQVFATTHSFECVQSVYKGLGKCGFKYFRLDKYKDGETQAVRYSHDMAEMAIERHMEVR